MEESFVKIKSHLIITDIHSEYHINWHGKIANCDPVLRDGLPVFIVIGSRGRIELNTIDIHRLEDCAKRLTQPKGRTAITSDSARIYIKERSGKETPLCVVTHKCVKSFAPMYDKVGYR